MPYVVPKFIEMKPKIVGPLTFKQFIFIGIAGAISFLLYFTLAKKSFFLFIVFSFILISGALSLAFLKSGGQPLPTILKNFFIFSARPKLYIFKKKVLPPKLVPKKETPPKKKEEPVLKVTPKPGRLQKLSTRVTTRTK